MAVRTGNLWVIAAALLVFGGGAAKAGAISAAGVIVDVSPPGSVLLHRQGERSEPLKSQSLVQPGDRYEFNGPAELIANVYGKMVVYTDRSENAVIPARPSGFFSRLDEAFIERFRLFFSSPRRSITVFPMSRGPGQPSKQRLGAHPLAPVGTQLLPPNIDHVALLWRNGPAAVAISAPGQTLAPVSSGRNGWIIAALPASAASAQVALVDETVRWSIVRSATVPAPPWLAGARPTSEEQRLVRAVWLLGEGTAGWHLFALTELADLSASGNFAAAQFWQGIRSGELDAAALKSTLAAK